MKDIRVYCIKNKPMDMSLVKKGISKENFFRSGSFI